MLGVTWFGLLFTPAFYTFVRKLGRKDHEAASGYSTSREVEN
jgi:ABC-type transport system involved in cytochrome bd biosynthesis fused ATPase/permease subunit